MCHELVHGDEDDGDSDQKVQSKLVAEGCRGHKSREDGCHGGGVLLEDSVCKFVEERG